MFDRLKQARMLAAIRMLASVVILASVLLAACGTPTTPFATTSPDKPAATATEMPSATGSPAPASSGGAHLSLVQSDLPRDTAPQVAGEAQEALAAGNRAFALDLYRELREQKGNLFYSPYSISTALAMAYAGAAGETQRQMADGIFRFDFGQVSEFTFRLVGTAVTIACRRVFWQDGGCLVIVVVPVGSAHNWIISDVVQAYSEYLEAQRSALRD